MSLTRSVSTNVAGLSGADELVDAFHRLADAVQRRIARKALTAGLEVLVRAGQDAVPAAETPGHDNSLIRKAIRGRLTSNAGGGDVTGKVGINVGGHTAPLGAIFVLGTVDRYTGARTRKVRGRLTSKKTGNPVAFRGRMPENDFFDPAVEAAEADAVAVMQQVFASEVAAEFAQ